MSDKTNLTREQKGNLKKWIKAMRSGNYRQTHYALKDGHGYCCLGVACEINKRLGQAENVCDPDLPNPTIFQEEYGFGLKGVLHCGGPKGVCSSLSTLNDVYKLNFEEIANVIEKQILSGKQNSEKT